MPTLKAIFEQQVPPRYLKQKFQDCAAYNKQTDLLKSLKDADAPEEYKSLVLKLFIQQIESQSRFIHEDISEAYAHIMSHGPCQKEKEKIGIFSPDNIVHYSMNDNIKISIVENPNVISSQGSTGYRTWEASLALLECMLSFANRELKARLKGVPDPVLQQLGVSFELHKEMAVVELGAGTGLAGLMICKLSGRNAILTDGDEEVVAQLQRNIELNSLQTKCQAQRLYWGKDAAVTAEPGRQQVVLAADVTYDPGAAPLLVSTIKEFLTKTDTRFCLVSATVRSTDTFNAFMRECKKKSIKVVHIEHYSSPFDNLHFFVEENTPDILVMGLTLQAKPV
jgi:protein-lysine N-methyltransferase EEF2KMT